MQRRSSIFPGGQTTASKVKALLGYLDAVKGAEIADGWLQSIQMERSELEDETHLISIVTLHGALRAFANLCSREAIADTWKYHVAPENLGVWMRVLRGAAKPEEAFAQIDGTESEYGRTTRWETLEARDGCWRGRVHIGHDPGLEADGLLGSARAAELTCVPALFGYGHGIASAATTTARDATQEFEVRWATPNPARSGGIGAAIGAALGALPIAIHPSAITAGVALVALAGGAIAGSVIARDKRRRAETCTQVSRVNALERGLLLKEGRDREAAGNLEGSVVAGQFRIRQRMGSGASGVIYEAVRINDNVPVAIKLLRAAAAHDATASDRLRREAEALGLSWHPNVVEVIDHGHLADGTAYLVMELLAGESLASRLKSRIRLTPAELHPIAAQVAEALVAVHAAGVVHRDLKPSNIYLTPPSDPAFDDVEIVKVLDFGIARVEWEETRITNMGSPVGTTGYMSPEQESGGLVDARSDVFALGAVLYECLVGEPPPSAPQALWRASIAPPGEALTSGVQMIAVPPAWKSLIEKAMARSPDDRYQDARSFVQALRGLRQMSTAPRAHHTDG